VAFLYNKCFTYSWGVKIERKLHLLIALLLITAISVNAYEYVQDLDNFKVHKVKTMDQVPGYPTINVIHYRNDDSFFHM